MKFIFQQSYAIRFCPSQIRLRLQQQFQKFVPYRYQHSPILSEKKTFGKIFAKSLLKARIIL